MVTSFFGLQERCLAIYHPGYLIYGWKECICGCEMRTRRCAFDGGGDEGRELPGRLTASQEILSCRRTSLTGLFLRACISWAYLSWGAGICKGVFYGHVAFGPKLQSKLQP